jgi:hypothetical protein
MIQWLALAEAILKMGWLSWFCQSGHISIALHENGTIALKFEAVMHPEGD